MPLDSVDYRCLNKVIMADPYQMSMVQELLDNIAGAAWLTKAQYEQGLLSGVPRQR